VTTTFPVVAPAGTGTTMLVADQLVGVAVVPLNFTEPVPCVAPKFAPAIVTDAPTGPDVGDRLVMLGVESTVKVTPLLLTPAALTTMFPVVAPAGTGATILVALHVVTVAAVPLNVTVLVPCVAPKFEPPIVTAMPAAPDAGDRLVMDGVGSTVNISVVQDCGVAIALVPSGVDSPSPWGSAAAEEIDAFSGATLAVFADSESVAAYGPNPLDPACRVPSAEAGRVQGRRVDRTHRQEREEIALRGCRSGHVSA